MMIKNVQVPLALIESEKTENVFTVFDNSIENGQKVTLAFSGGKDSTSLALLFYEWLKDRPDLSIEINILHNDTSSEIDFMENWARDFMQAYKTKIEKITDGRVRVKLDLKSPKVIDTFYWRVLVRGYPAPSFNFRWCVHLLKEKPAKLDNIEGKIFTGLRDGESSTRSGTMKKKYGNSCGANPGGCMAYYYSTEGKGNKVAPFRDWSDTDIWAFLWGYRGKGDFDLSPLFVLYQNPKIRYGCWHCTLASVQWGLHSLGNGLEYFEAVRILYRKFSDLPYLRKKKNTGYSNLGPLNATGRAIIFKLILLAEELSGNSLYGLDLNVLEGKTLRDIFFNVPSAEAAKLIKKYDPTIPKYRYVPISRVRDTSKNKGVILRAIHDAKKNCLNDKAYKLLKMRDVDPLVKLLDHLQNLLS